MALLKSESLLSAVEVTAFGVVFLSPDPDDRLHRRLEMSYQDWSHMGQPKEITITIEPGDKLNSDSPFDEPKLQEIS